jgi:quercetin dioxygenase-like cupin family protein
MQGLALAVVTSTMGVSQTGKIWVTYTENEHDSPFQASVVVPQAGYYSGTYTIPNVGDQVVTVSEIRFRPGERTKFHYHDYGQILYVVDGQGIVATRGEEREVTRGDLIFFPPDEEHWHGTAVDSSEAFAHLSMVLRDDPNSGTHPVDES